MSRHHAGGVKAAKRRLQQALKREQQLSKKEKHAQRQLLALAVTHNRLIVQLRVAKLLNPVLGESMRAFITRGTKAISSVENRALRKGLLHAFSLRVAYLRSHAKELRTHRRVNELAQKVQSKAASPPRRPLPPLRKKGI